jgi:hypothetical protein
MKNIEKRPWLPNIEGFFPSVWALAPSRKLDSCPTIVQPTGGGKGIVQQNGVVFLCRDAGKNRYDFYRRRRKYLLAFS